MYEQQIWCVRWVNSKNAVSVSNCIFFTAAILNRKNEQINVVWIWCLILLPFLISVARAIIIVISSSSIYYRQTPSSSLQPAWVNNRSFQTTSSSLFELSLLDCGMERDRVPYSEATWVKCNAFRTIRIFRFSCCYYCFIIDWQRQMLP